MKRVCNSTHASFLCKPYKQGLSPHPANWLVFGQFIIRVIMFRSRSTARPVPPKAFVSIWGSYQPSNHCGTERERSAFGFTHDRRVCEKIRSESFFWAVVKHKATVSLAKLIPNINEIYKYIHIHNSAAEYSSTIYKARIPVLKYALYMSNMSQQTHILQKQDNAAHSYQGVCTHISPVAAVLCRDFVSG